GPTAGAALRPDRARGADVGAAVRPGVGDARGHLGVPRPADPARPLRRGAEAVRADLRPLRGAGPAHLQPFRRAAAQGHRQPVDGPPDERHERHRPAGRRRLRAPAPQPRRRAGSAGRDHRGGPGGGADGDGGAHRPRLRSRRPARGRAGRPVRHPAPDPAGGRRRGDGPGRM
ncbi:MAG: Transcriptional regulator, MarR family, partial [uncultured Blastococcus sp.]